MKMKKSLALLSAVLCFSNANVAQVDGLVGVSIDWLSLDKGKNLLGKGASESIRFKRASAALYNILVGFLYNCGNGFRVGPEFSYGFTNKKSRLECSEHWASASIKQTAEFIKGEAVADKDVTDLMACLPDGAVEKGTVKLTSTDNCSRKVRSVGTFSVKFGGQLNSDVAAFVSVGYTFANIKITRAKQIEGTDFEKVMEEAAKVVLAKGTLSDAQSDALLNAGLKVLLDKKYNKAAKPKKHGVSFGLEGSVKVAPNCSIALRAMYVTSVKLCKVGVAVIANF